MFRFRWRPFRLFGIPLAVDASWLLILALITWTVSEILLRPPEPLAWLYPPGGLGLNAAGYLLAGFVTALLFFACIVLHEMGHALVARSSGMTIRGITLFLFGGVSELEGEPPSAGVEFAVAVAGPAVSLVLALVCALLTWMGHVGGWPGVVVVVLAYLTWVNGMVLLFNLIPAFPLDGGRVLRSILWGVSGRLRRATYWAALCGRAFAWLLIALGVLEFFGHEFFGGIWLALIGLFLNSAARGSYQQVVIKEALRGEPVLRLLTEQPVLVPPEADLHQFVDGYVFGYHRRGFPVGHGDRVEGYVSTEMLAGIPRGEWDRHTVGEVMRHDLEPIAIPPQADAVTALERMQHSGSSRLLVLDGDRVVGVLGMKDLLRFLHLKLEIEGDEGPSPPTAAPPLVDRRRETPARPER